MIVHYSIPDYNNTTYGNRQIRSVRGITYDLKSNSSIPLWKNTLCLIVPIIKRCKYAGKTHMLTMMEQKCFENNQRSLSITFRWWRTRNLLMEKRRIRSLRKRTHYWKIGHLFHIWNILAPMVSSVKPMTTSTTCYFPCYKGATESLIPK